MISAGAELRVLQPGDEPELFAFLTPYLDSSVFLFSNVEKAGLEDHGQPLQGTYVARHNPAGAITAVASHFWNGNVMVQGDDGLEQAARHAVLVSGREVRGIIGPWSLACRVRTALGLDETRAAHDDREQLFALSLDDLHTPELLSRADVALRSPTEAEATGVLAGWRTDYHVEALGAARSHALESAAREQVRSWCTTGTLWVLTIGTEVVAMSGFNAETRGIVQIGGVFTPPSQRCRGYARAAVAASLQLARARGATRSILFTPEANLAARRAYMALGYRVISDFGLLLF